MINKNIHRVLSKTKEKQIDKAIYKYYLSSSPSDEDISKIRNQIDNIINIYEYIVYFDGFEKRLAMFKIEIPNDKGTDYENTIEQNILNLFVQSETPIEDVIPTPTSIEKLEDGSNEIEDIKPNPPQTENNKNDKQFQKLKEESEENKLINCPMCNGIISKFAITCPYCGHPLKQIEINKEIIVKEEILRMRRWEYKRIQTETSSINLLDRTLDELGRDGWELVTAVHCEESVGFGILHYLHLYLKRESKGLYDQTITDSIADYTKAIKINPGYAEAYHNRGIAYGKKGLYDQAIADYNKALEINPGFAEAYNNRGITYYSKGLYDQAIADYNKALEINPGFAEAYYNKAISCEKVGRIKEAVEAYKEFIHYAPPQYASQIELVRHQIQVLEGK